MLETYKVVTNKANIDKSYFFEFSFAPTRGHQYKLRRMKSTKLARIQIFPQRVVIDWNFLRKEVVQARTLNEFKARIDEHWKDEQYVTPFDYSCMYN